MNSHIYYVCTSELHELPYTVATTVTIYRAAGKTHNN